MSMLIVLYGLPAVGKYTIGECLSRITGIPLFHNHLVMDVLYVSFPFGSDSFVKLREQFWLLYIEETMRKGQSLIFTFCPERTARPIFLDQLGRLAKSFTTELIYIQLKCQEREMLRRCASPSRKKFKKVIDPEFYRQALRNGVFAFDYDFPTTLTLHTDVNSPEDAASIILHGISDTAPRH